MKKTPGRIYLNQILNLLSGAFPMDSFLPPSTGSLTAWEHIEIDSAPAVGDQTSDPVSLGERRNCSTIWCRLIFNATIWRLAGKYVPSGLVWCLTTLGRVMCKWWRLIHLITSGYNSNRILFESFIHLKTHFIKQELYKYQCQCTWLH